jgi:DNA polymerase epsilon subunit 2
LLSNGIFQVNTCGFPPLEDREASLSMLMGLDFFGGGVIAAEETVRLSTLEKKAMNDMFVILSDVWLDSSEVFTFVLVPNTN